MIANWFSDIRRHPVLMALSILTLSLTLSVTLFLDNQILRERSFDRFYPDYQHIFRVETVFDIPDGTKEPSARVSTPVSRALVRDYPQISRSVFLYRRRGVVRFQGQQVDTGIFMTQDDLFHKLNILKPGQPLPRIQAGKAILSTRLARRLFGRMNARGRLISIDGSSFEVSRVVTYRKNTNFKVPVLLSIDSTLFSPFRKSSNDWYKVAGYLYVWLTGTRPISHASLRSFVKSEAPKIPGAPFTPESFMHLSMVPITQLHFDRGLDDDMRTTVTAGKSMTLELSTLVLLLVAGLDCFGLVFLIEHAKSKDLSTKWLIGASSFQVLAENIASHSLTAVIVVLFCLTLAPLSADVLAAVLTTHYTVSGIDIEGWLVWLVSVFLMTEATVAGATLSAFLISRANFSQAGRYTSLPAPIVNKASVLIQSLLASTLLATGSLVIVQDRFLVNADHGYSDHVVSAAVNGDGKRIRQSLRQFLAAVRSPTSGFRSATLSGWEPFDPNRTVVAIASNDLGRFHSRMPTADLISADRHFFAVWKIPILAGVIPSLSQGSANDDIVINQRLSTIIGAGTPEQAIGRTLHFGKNDAAHQIVAVCGNFRLRGMKEPISPLIVLDRPTGQIVSVASDSPLAARKLQKIWSRISARPVTFRTVRQIQQSAYRDDTQLGQLLIAAASLCVFLCLVGVVCIGHHETWRLSRAFFIMKTLGARRSDIATHFLRHTMLPIAIGCLIAIPIAVYVGRVWLGRFAVHTPGMAYVAIVSVSSLFATSLICLITLHVHQQLMTHQQRPSD